MLKANSKMFDDLCEEGIKDDKKDNDIDSYDDLDGVLKDLLDDLKNLKETMKDIKKED